MKRDSKKIIQSAIEVGSGEKEIITVIKSLNNFEIGFEVGFSTSTVKVSGNDDNHEATMTTANKLYFSAKVATTFENLPMYKAHQSADKCIHGNEHSRTDHCIPHYWELIFSSVVMDRQQLDNDTIWESQKAGTAVIADTYQFVFTVVPNTSQYHGEDFNVFVLYGLVIQHNTIKGDYYKTNIDDPSSIAEEKCDVAQTPSDVINYCEKKTYNKSGYSGGFLFGAHWVIPKYYSNFGVRLSGADSINAKFYYGFYYAF